VAKDRMLLAGGRVIDPASGKVRLVDILVEDGRIARVGKGIRAKDAQRIDCKGKHVAPGFIDMHCHLREPGYEDAETILTGTQSALVGGFTRVCPMPNTDPPVDSEAMVRFQIERAEQAGYASVHPIGCCTRNRAGKELAEIGSMREAGAVAISDDGDWISDPRVMRRALEYAKAFDMPVISHCEYDGLSDGVANEGLVSTRLGLSGKPWPSETAAAARDIMLAEFVGARVHIAHVSCAATVDLIRWAKLRGVQVTAEACPHHFTLTDAALAGFDTNFKVNPPLRTETDRLAVIQGVVNGTIDAIATDHAPHTKVAKEVEFDQARPGIIGFETAFSLGYEQFVVSGQMSPAQYIEKLTLAPARIMGLRVPSVAEGVEAELVILDLKAQWTFSGAQIMSKSSNTPFLERTMQGLVVGGVLGEEHFWLLHTA
jgi:dihydroorotase